MTSLNLSPVITAIRSRPDEFEFSNNALHHPSSRHSFRFVSDSDLRIDALCDCSMLRAAPEQIRVFHAAYREWYSAYWRPTEINREFASHFAPPSLWRRCAIRLLEHLLARPRSSRSASVRPAMPVASTF